MQRVEESERARGLLLAVYWSCVFGEELGCSCLCFTIYEKRGHRHPLLHTDVEMSVIYTRSSWHQRPDKGWRIRVSFSLMCVGKKLTMYNKSPKRWPFKSLLIKTLINWGKCLSREMELSSVQAQLSTGCSW